MKLNIARLLTYLVIPLAISSCSTMGGPETPDFYPNARYLNSPPAEVQYYEKQCMDYASEYIKQPDKYKTVLKDGLIGGAVGAGAGAIGGAIMGHAGPATGAGAAIGGLLGVLKGLKDVNEPSPTYERFMEHCLSMHGYTVIGWSSK